MSGARRPARRVAGAPPAVVAGRRGALEAVRGGLATQVLLATGSRATPGLRELVEAAGRAGIPVREVERAELDALAPDHHGAVAHVRARDPIGERELAAWPFEDDAVVVILDGIEDPQNLGAAARSAEAAGAAMLVIRTRRAAGVTPAAVRASAGALAHLPCARVANIARALDRLKDAGFTVVGLDERAPATVYEAEPPAGRIAIVVGSEAGGMARLTRQACDLLVALPMRGRVASLNASSALAAVLYAFVLRRPGDGGA